MCMGDLKGYIPKFAFNFAALKAGYSVGALTATMRELKEKGKLYVPDFY